MPAGTKEWAFAASGAGFVGAASSVANEDAVAGPTSGFSVGPVIGVDGRIFAATGSGTATLHAYTLTTTPAIALNDRWNVGVGVNVSAPPAIDVAGSVLAGTVDGKLSKTAPGETRGTLTPIVTLPGSIVDSPVILPNGDIVVGDDTGLLHRYSESGAQVWTTEPNLGAAVQAPMVMTDPSTPLIVPSAGGKIFAVRGNGTVAWSATLESGNALRAPNLYTPIGAGPVISTAYLTSASGKLFAIIVDGQLDASAPWPKAFHDPRNTNRAGPQP
jgi:hypothetical protein